MARTRVLVLFGGRSSEHSISVVSAGSVISAIDADRFEVIPVGITPEGAWVAHHGRPELMVIVDGELPVVGSDGAAAALSLDPRARGVWFEETDGSRRFEGVDVVFPVLHGPHGEDGAVQGLFELAGLPYVGSGILASAACMDKTVTKQILRDAGIPAGRWHSFDHADWDSEARGASHIDVVSGLGWPVFVKPARAGSSMGVSKVHGPEHLGGAVTEAGRHDSRIIVEASVEGAREIECGVLVGADGRARASVPAEIRVREGHEFYDFEAKYLDDSAELIVPAQLPPGVTEAVQRMALTAFDALGCRGLARVDFFLDAAQGLVVNEINTMPGFTPISMYPRMWQATGVTYPELIATLLADAVERP